MDWYCKFCNTEEGKQCPYRDKELSEGPVLVSTGGQAGAWYISDEIDTRPQAVLGWKEISAYACNCGSEKDCPGKKAQQETIDRFVSETLQQGDKYAWNVEREMYDYLMTRNNWPPSNPNFMPRKGPWNPSDPKYISLPIELVDEAQRKLRKELDARELWNN